jgi:hypothetical protein
MFSGADPARKSKSGPVSVLATTKKRLDAEALGAILSVIG